MTCVLAKAEIRIRQRRYKREKGHPQFRPWARVPGTRVNPEYHHIIGSLVGSKPSGWIEPEGANAFALLSSVGANLDKVR